MTIPKARPTPQAFTNFGALLCFLRRRARLTQRELSIAVGYNFARYNQPDTVLTALERALTLAEGQGYVRSLTARTLQRASQMSCTSSA
jgi:hypothetical protein